jgi:catechol 2,3-dioxygenase
LDHVNLMAQDVTRNKEFMEEYLGFRLREHVVFEDGSEGGAWLSVSPLVHEVAFMGDQTGTRGRFHHVCYWYGIPQHTSDAAEVLRENGVKIEAGPGKHGISQALFIYVFEPGGNRVELFGDAGYLILDPDWKPATWKGEDIETGIIFYGSPLPGEYFMYGTPPLEGQEPEGIDEMQQVLQQAASENY